MKAIEEAISNALDRADGLGECQLARSYRQLAEWLTELRDIKTGATPLADRLTAEERKKIKELHEMLDYDPRESLGGVSYAPYYLLESIFGKEMFEGEGGSDD